MNHTHNKKASGAINAEGFTNQQTNGLYFATGHRECKAYTTRAARLAIVGHTLVRSNPADGAVLYFVGRWGYVKTCASLDAVAQFAAQIGVGHA